MKTEDLKVGKTVQLVSGGPIMTVNGIGPAKGFAKCRWFDGAVLKHDAFDPETLKEVSDSSASAK